MLQIKTGGEWLLSTGFGWSDVTLNDQWPGGCWEAAWTMPLPLGWRHRLLDRGRLVEVYDGALRIWRGTMQEADWSSGRFTAAGPWRDAEKYPALDGSGNSSTNSNTVIDAAITAGWPVVRNASYGGNALTASGVTSDLMNVDELLTLHATTLGQFPAVNADGEIYRAASDTVPSWLMVPDSASLGTADDDFASRVVLRYQDSTNSGAYTTADVSDATAAARFGVKAQTVDATSLGPITPTVAGLLANGMLTDGRARPGWVDTIEATPWKLLTIGGMPADLALPRYGQVVRLMGLFDNTVDLNGRTWLDIVIGATTKTWARDRISSLTITPAGYVSRTFASVTEDIYKRLKDHKRLVKV